MELPEAFRHALDGNAVVFLGAGFSLGSSNREDKDFPLASHLARDLMLDLGKPESVRLQTASSIYIRERGAVGLLAFLERHLGVQEVACYHRTFARVPWQRVYTTNYDEVFEKAAREVGSGIRP